MANVADIQSIPEGQAIAARGPAVYVQVARRGGKYVVEAGWEVPEAHDDDYMSSPAAGFRPRRQCPWVGRSVSTDDAAEALATYNDFRKSIKDRRVITRGDAIGSVAR